MEPDETRAFVASPDHDDLVALRRADDAAKERGRIVPGLDTWRTTVDRFLPRTGVKEVAGRAVLTQVRWSRGSGEE